MLCKRDNILFKCSQMLLCALCLCVNLCLCVSSDLVIKPGGQITLAHIGAAVSPLPHQLNRPVFPHYDLCYESLLVQTPDGYDTRIAQSFSYIDDHRIRVFIHKAAYFHDGSAITSHDFKRALSYFSSNQTVPFIRTLCQSIHFELVNTHEFILVGDTEKSLALLSLIPLFKLSESQPQLFSPIGSGPYQLLLPPHSKDQSPSDMVIYQKHSYWGKHLPFSLEKNHLSQIRYQLFHSTFDANIAFHYQQIDGYVETSSARFAKIQQTMPFAARLIHHPQQQYTQNLILNPHHPLLQDQSIRTALSHLWMRELLNKKLYHQQYQVIHPPKTTTSLTHLHDALVEVSHALAKHGWVMDGSLFLRKNTQKLSLSILMYHHQWDAAILLFSQQLRRVGIELKCEYVSKANYYHRLRNQQFELVIEPLIINRDRPTMLPDYFSMFQVLSKIQSIQHFYQQTEFKSNRKQTPCEKQLLTNLQYDLWVIPLFAMNHYRIVLNPKFHIPQKAESIDPTSWYIA